MSKQLTRQLINSFKASFVNDEIAIPGALRQEEAGIVFTGLVDPNEKRAMNKDTALDPSATASLLALPGGETAAPQPQLPPGTMENQPSLFSQPSPVNPRGAAETPAARPAAPAPPATREQQAPPAQTVPQPNAQQLADRLLLE